MLTAWAQNDPTAAVATALALPPVEYRPTSSSDLFSIWAARNPQEAYTAANRIADSGSIRRNALLGVFNAWAQSDPAAAEVAGQREENPNIRRDLNGALIVAAARLDPKSAFAHLQSFSDGDIGLQTWNKLFGAWAERNPAEAVATAKGLPQGSHRRLALQGALDFWAQYQPEAAIAVVRDLDLAERLQMVSSIAMALVDTDPAAAIKFWEANPPSTNQRWTISSIMGRGAARDPEAAFDAALKLKRPGDRQEKAFRGCHRKLGGN